MATRKKQKKKEREKENIDLSIPTKVLRWKPHSTHPEGCVDSAGERVQDVDILMLVQQDEAQEDLQEGWLGDAAQKKV